ncbi:hypothetical protein BKA70DRAFT_1116038 [Coprinopsis sp. MPI-PUGE-AT-0042]|nr:hypothetical protein BKA70DRAFT_1116038 [Coprinopsis sp. MPI-PUGE-AT-0042]
MAPKRELEQPQEGDSDASSSLDAKRARGSTTNPPKPGNRSQFRLASGSSTTRRSSRNTTIKVNDDGNLSRKRQIRTSEIAKDSSSSKRSTPEPTTSEASKQQAQNAEINHEQELDGQASTTTTTGSSKRDRSYKNWIKLQDWIPRRQSFLDELLHHDGLGDSLDRQTCSDCPPTTSATGLYKCIDCWDGSLLRCKTCVLLNHSKQPLHRIEKWNGRFFEKTTLFSLGLRLQLGHGGGPCERSIAGPASLLVFHTTGVHRVSVDYCDCRTIDRLSQLMRARWFPATLDRVQTVFTFDAIDHFQELTLQGKTTLYDYYHTLIRLTDNMKLGEIPSRCNDFHRVVRLWRTLFSAKRGARGQDPGGIDSTAEGELAQECPACPHPGKNLPDGWKEAGSRLFLYTLFLAMDANFKLKGKDRGITDLEMAPGWSYCVNEHKYQEYLINFAHEEEINTCHSEHDAIVRASVRRTPGYNVTGAGLVICSRHGLVRANGIGDLQKGETYANMTYIFFAAVMAVALLRIVITYDIACQWSKNLYSRMATLPENLRKGDDVKITAAIPSWHINAHGSDCQVNFALGYREGNGRTCGDEIEGTWDHTNSLGTSVREMAPGARHETLNDHFSGYNFHKIVGLRQNLLKKLKEAHKMQAKHIQNHALFTSTFKEETIREWTADIEAWNADNRKPNPYEDKPLNITLQDVRLELSQQDAEDTKKGAVIISDVSPSSFLVTGLDLEETQRVLAHDQKALSEKATAKERADLHDKVMSWNRRVQTWREVQLKHLPCAAQLLPADPETDPKSVQLILPSSLSPILRSTAPKMAEIERKLRIAQCDDALAEIRRQRRLITGLWTFKKLNLSGQGNKPNTRLRGVYNRMNAKTDRLADRYRAAHKALLALETDKNAAWRSRLKVLGPKDVSGPGKEADESSGHYQPSWIWLVSTATPSEDIGQQEFNSSMRVEWARSRARKDRWCEEYLLLQEEMRRVVAYLAWKADWWDSKVSLHVGTSLDGSILSGVGAYARKQASLLRQLAVSSVTYWKAPLASMGITIEWAPITSIEVDPLGPGAGRQSGDLEIFVVDADSDEEDDEDDDREVSLELDACVFENDM